METNIFKDFMIGDWVAYGNHIVRIVKIGKNSARIDFEGNESGPWELSYDNPPRPIPLTPEILLKNGFKGRKASYYIEAEGRLIRVILDGIHAGISVCDADEIRRYNRCSLFETPTVHRLQHALRLCGLGELADNFKV